MRVSIGVAVMAICLGGCPEVPPGTSAGADLGVESDLGAVHPDAAPDVRDMADVEVMPPDPAHQHTCDAAFCLSGALTWTSGASGSGRIIAGSSNNDQYHLQGNVRPVAREGNGQ